MPLDTYKKSVQRRWKTERSLEERKRWRRDGKLLWKKQLTLLLLNFWQILTSNTVSHSSVDISYVRFTNYSILLYSNTWYHHKKDAVYLKGVSDFRNLTSDCIFTRQLYTAQAYRHTHRWDVWQWAGCRVVQFSELKTEHPLLSAPCSHWASRSSIFNWSQRSAKIWANLLCVSRAL